MNELVQLTNWKYLMQNFVIVVDTKDVKTQAETKHVLTSDTPFAFKIEQMTSETGLKVTVNKLPVFSGLQTLAIGVVDNSGSHQLAQYFVENGVRTDRVVHQPGNVL